jgi:hypothetical protein
MNQMTLRLARGDTLGRDIRPRLHVRLTSFSANIGSVGVFDRQSPPGRPVQYHLERGLKLEGASHVSPLLLDFHMQHYGGNESLAQLDVTWT